MRLRVLYDMTQLPFDPQAAAKAKTEAMAQVEAHARVEWKDAALEAVRAAALASPSFIVDEVWPHLDDDVQTHELRAMGPVMRRAATLGYIAPTDRYRLSSRISAHKNPRRVWRSLIYEVAL